MSVPASIEPYETAIVVARSVRRDGKGAALSNDRPG